jgi:phosphopantothenate synthetase
MISLDATSLPRFMTCRGSIDMVVEDLLADQPNTVRDEGNAFHWLLEKPRPFAQYVDTKAKKRYLKVTATPAVSVNTVVTARLSRGEEAPVTAADAGVIGWVKG